MNDNRIDLSKFRGETIPCTMCKNKDLPLHMRIACRWCMTSGYVALCLCCNSTGHMTAPATWDGGASTHTSVCNICGGLGTFPSRAINLLRTKPAAKSTKAAKKAAAPVAPLSVPTQPAPQVDTVHTS